MDMMLGFIVGAIFGGFVAFPLGAIWILEGLNE